MSANWIVRHGATRFLGEFDPEGVAYERGDEVVVRSERGLEHAQILCVAEDHALDLLSEPTRGRIVRKMTPADFAERRRLKEREAVELETSIRFVGERNLQMEVVDVEHLFGGERIVFYFLAEKRVDFRDLVKDLCASIRRGSRCAKSVCATKLSCSRTTATVASLFAATRT